MAESIVLDAQMREVTGKKVKQLRRAGLVPAVVYGKHDPISIQLNTHTTMLALRDADDNALFDLDIDGGEKLTVLVRDAQRHVTRGDLLHVDFYEISAGETITVDVNLVTINSPDVPSDIRGNAAQLLFTVSIEAIPSKLISEIEVDLSQIKDPNDVVMVGDLAIPEGVTLLTEGDIAVAKFNLEQEVVEEVEDEEGLAAAAVPVIGAEDEEE